MARLPARQVEHAARRDGSCRPPCACRDHARRRSARRLSLTAMPPRLIGEMVARRRHPGHQLIADIGQAGEDRMPKLQLVGRAPGPGPPVLAIAAAQRLQRVAESGAHRVAAAFGGGRLAIVAPAGSSSMTSFRMSTCQNHQFLEALVAHLVGQHAPRGRHRARRWRSAAPAGRWPCGHPSRPSPRRCRSAPRRFPVARWLLTKPNRGPEKSSSWMRSHVLERAAFGVSASSVWMRSRR